MKKIALGVISLSSGAVAVLAVSSAVLAADLPGRRQAPAPVSYLSPTPVFSWTGAYVGINGGFDFANFTKGGRSAFGSANGGLLGATVGYNYQFSPNVVAGVEADYGWTNVSAKKVNIFSANSFSKSTVNNLFTLRGRIGYAADRALIYATGGYAGANVKSSLNDIGNGLAGADSSYRSGYALGGGIEYAFTNNISAKAEYLYTSLSRKAMFPGVDVIKPGVNVQTVRAGVNYRF